MDIVTQAQKAARRQIFSPAVLEQIKGMVARGLSPPEIAARIGCTLGSLRVKCSNCGISLRRRPSAEKKFRPRLQLKIKFAGDTALRLQQEADRRGISVTTLVTLLIETIVQDNLYGAIIDDEPALTLHKRDAAVGAPSQGKVAGGMRRSRLSEQFFRFERRGG